MSNLQSSTDTAGVDTDEHRVSLYHNKYKYKAQFTVSGLRRTRYRKTYEIFVHEIDESLKEDYIWNNSNIRGWRETLKREYTTYDMAAIKRYYDWLEYNDELSKTWIRRQEGDIIMFYCNDLDLLLTLNNIAPTTITQAIVSLDPEVKLFENEPKHRFRAYFKDRLAGMDNIESINKFLNNNRATVFPSYATKEHFTGHSRWAWNRDRTVGSHFVDYDDEGMYLIMKLHFGKYLGKHYRLEKRPTTP